jgi:ribosomal protein S18 acetylase RimI-like enzyme
VRTAGARLREGLRESDAEAVQKLVGTSAVFSPEEVAVAVDLVRETLAAGPASGYRFAFADAAASVVGYVCWGPIPLTRASFDLYWIAVDPTVRSRGLGRRLLAHAEERARTEGAQRLYVDTSGRADYAPARAFYEHCGYRIEARLPDFYSPGDDKLVYTKPLSGGGAG